MKELFTTLSVITLFEVSVNVQQETTATAEKTPKITSTVITVTEETTLNEELIKSSISYVDKEVAELLINPVHANESKIVMEALKTFNFLLDDTFESLKWKNTNTNFTLKFLIKSGGPKMLRVKPCLSLLKTVYRWNDTQLCHQTPEEDSWTELTHKIGSQITDILLNPLWIKQGTYLISLLDGYNIMLTNVLKLAGDKNDAEAISCIMDLKNTKGPSFLQVTLDTDQYKRVFNWTDNNILRLECLLDETEDIWTMMEQLNYYNATYNLKINPNIDINT